MKSKPPNLLYLFIAFLIIIYVFYRLFQKKKIYDHILRVSSLKAGNLGSPATPPSRNDFFKLPMGEFSIQSSLSFLPKWFSYLTGTVEREGLTNPTLINAAFTQPAIAANTYRYLVNTPGMHPAIVPGWNHYSDSGSLAIINGKNAFTGSYSLGQGLAFQGGAVQYIEQQVTLNPGQYKVILAALGRPGAFYSKAQSFQIVFGTIMSPVYNSIPNYGWRQYEFTFDIPANTKPATNMFKFLIKSPAADTSIMLTNISITQLKEYPILVEQPAVVNTTIADTTAPPAAPTAPAAPAAPAAPSVPASSQPSTAAPATLQPTIVPVQPSAPTPAPPSAPTPTPAAMPTINSVMTEAQVDKIIKNEVKTEIAPVKEEIKKTISPLNFDSITKYILSNPNNPDTSSILETLKSQVKEEFILEKKALNKKKQDEYEAAANYKNLANLPLKEYAIKSSFNSAYDGTTVSLAALKTCILNGYRFIDLHIFQGADDSLYVGFSPDNNTTLIDSMLPLHKALNYISTYAFSRDRDLKIQDSDSPNVTEVYKDYPLFLNFRFYQRQLQTGGKRENKSAVDIIGQLYKDYFSSNGIFSQSMLLKEGNQSAKQINGMTRLKELNGKIVIVMDINNILKYYSRTNNPDEVPNSTKEVLDKLVNIKTGGHSWKTFHGYATSNLEKYPLYAKDNEYETNTKNMYLIYPGGRDENNPDTIALMTNYKIQTIPARTYIKDANLEKHTAIYNFYKMPFVPMRNILIYGKQ